jgi:ABC-type arginine transport system permease subunit
MTTGAAAIVCIIVFDLIDAADCLAKKSSIFLHFFAAAAAFMLFFVSIKQHKHLLTHYFTKTPS